MAEASPPRSRTWVAQAFGTSRLSRTWGLRQPLWLGGVLTLAAYGTALVLLRPASPFEGDEVLFLHSLAHYDIAVHSPHPPGYPAYVALGRALRWLVGDPLLALQLVSVSCAVVALWLTAALVRRLGGPGSSALLAAALLAVVPSFVMHANVGLSDVPGTAAGLASVLLLLSAWERPTWLSAAGGISALAIAVRPQLLLLLLPLGTAVVVRALRRGQRRQVVHGIAAGLLASLAFWVPAVLATGPARFVSAMLRQSQYFADVDMHQTLFESPLVPLLDRWLIRPFGPLWLGLPFWLIVLAGSWAWWRRGQRVLVAVSAAVALVYIFAAASLMGIRPAARYVLPAVPFLAVLAAGLGAAPRRALRVTGRCLVTAWLLAAVIWPAPAYALRREPAPVWAALTWVRDNYEPGSTTVVYAGPLLPHMGYLLRPAGFHLVKLQRGAWDDTSSLPGRTVLLVTTEPRGKGEELFSRWWAGERISRLTEGRYLRCVVSRAPPGAAGRGRTPGDASRR